MATVAFWPDAGSDWKWYF